jgi:MFS family permease
MKQKAFILWTVWFLSSLFYAYQYIVRVLPNILMPTILEKYQIDANIFGQFSGIYYLGYALAHIPLGILLDRVGPKKVLPFCILITVLGLAPLVFTDIWLYPVIGRFLIGIGSSAAILGVFKIIRISFDEKYFSRILGFSVLIGLLGGIYGGLPVHYLITTYGVNMTLSVFIIIGAVLAVALYILIPEIKADESAENITIFKEITTVLSNKMVLSVCFLGAFMLGPLEGFADVWGTTFFTVNYQFSENLSAFLPSLLLIGMCFGAPLLSAFANQTEAYYRIIIASALIMGGSFVYLFKGVENLLILETMLFIVGFFCAYQILVIYKATTYVTARFTGLTTAVANMIIMIFGYVFHSLIGHFVNQKWDGTMLNNIPQYNADTLMHGLSVIPAGLFIAAIGFTVIAIIERWKRKNV